MTYRLHILHILHILFILLLLGAATPAFAQTITGNVYGGGEMAKVEGSTNVTIEDGKLGADIFGGGEGKLNNDGIVSMSADVSGETHVTINGGEFAVAYNTSKPQPYPFKQHYNIYGGGNIACQVNETHVYITKGMVSNASDDSESFLDNDRFENNEAGMAQAYYREGQMYFCVFGGGYGKNTSVTGDTWVDFNIGDGDGIQDISSTAIEDDLLEYQSYLDVIGGGFNGTIQGNTNVHVGGNAMCRNVYGGGLYATIGTKGDTEKGKTNVHITGGNVDNVYGGGVMGDIMTSTNVNIGLTADMTFDGHDHAKANDKVTILMSVYGGNDVSGHVPQVNITHNGGNVDQNIYGAGNGDYTGYYTPGLCAYADGENDNYYVVDHSAEGGPKGNTYKGRPQTDNVSITLGGKSDSDRAVVLGQVFGGGNSCTVGHWKTDLSGKYGGDPHKWRNDPTFFEGGGQLSITLNSHVAIGQDNEHVTADYKNADGENVSGLFMGASGSVLATQSDAPNYHHYYDSSTHTYKAGFSNTDGADSFKAYLNNILIWSDEVRLNFGTDAEDIWLANLVGGGFRGSMKRKTATNFSWTLPAGVTVGNCIVGGAYNADVHYTTASTNLQYKGGLLLNDGTTFADVVLTLNNAMDGGDKSRVFGGCFTSGTVKNTQIDYRATGAYDVYGGGALANLTGNSVVNLLGGSLTNAYGGGLGQSAAAAVGTEGEPGYVPAKVAVAALVEGNATTTLNGSIVKGSIFGANNINGTPKGHVKVHVLNTIPREIADTSPIEYEEYDVPAVYGGGNLSAYEPANADDYAEVLIENCDNSIDYVYGGGNAAPVPATRVTIYGANAINHAFAGGNGAGQSADPSAANYNPGADVGYLGYFSQGHASTYGTGKAEIDVLGGTVHHVYGGSNTLGYIRGGTNVTVKEAPDDYPNPCELIVGDVFGGGNEAPINCDITLNLDCSEGGDILYAGANDADVHGNITLNIVSGTFGKVFCGNNQGGRIYGNLKVNVDETGCWPVMIGELYGCGNEAPYSIYGYNDDGSCKTSGEKAYNDPVVNLVSFTRIGKVFGGGYGHGADLYGNTCVNVDPIAGRWSDGSPAPVFVLDADDNRVENTLGASVSSIWGNGGIGSIGSIYGGGNAGAVYGDTFVNIGLKSTNHHISGDDQTTEEDVAVMITGNVFGGGNEAIVSGDTNVKIGN